MHSPYSPDFAYVAPWRKTQRATGITRGGQLKKERMEEWEAANWMVRGGSAYLLAGCCLLA